MVDTHYITRSSWNGLSCTQTTYPSGREVNSGYDSLYRRNSVSEASGGANIAKWQFFGNRTATVCLGNGITCSFMNDARTNSAVQADVPNPPWGINTSDRLGFDGSGRLITKRYVPSCGGTTPVVGFTTQYDPSGNKLFERALQAENRSALYPQYDSMDRLLEYQRGMLASGGGSVASDITLPGTDSQRNYDLDGLGNWKNTVYTPEEAMAPTTEIRQHNKLNEITQFATTPVLYDHGNNTGTSYPNRGNGNIVDDGTRVYGYDALNRLTTVTRKSDSALVAAYTYDALGRRVQKVTQNGGISDTIVNAAYRYLYDNQQIIEEGLFPGESYSTLRQFVWGQYIDELIQMKTYANTGSQQLAVGVYYLLSDLLYRSSALTNSSGSVVEAYDTDAYGNTIIFSGPGSDGQWFTNDDVTSAQPACESVYTGRQYDPETQLYFYRARYYNPQLGRFISRDPLGYTDGQNLFEYTLSNPVIDLDAMGKQSTAARGPTNSGSPMTPSSPTTCPTTNVCGPDVTAPLKAVLARVPKVYAGWKKWQRLAACQAFHSFAPDPLRGGSPTWLNAWDIDKLHAWGGGQAWINAAPYSPPCATGKCNNTVEVSGKCFYAGSVNYVIFGVMESLCGEWQWVMDAFIKLYKWKTGGPNAVPAQAWADAGYNGWPAGAATPAADRPNCSVPCPVPYAGPAFKFYWAPNGLGPGGWL